MSLTAHINHENFLFICYIWTNSDWEAKVGYEVVVERYKNVNIQESPFLGQWLPRNYPDAFVHFAVTHLLSFTTECPQLLIPPSHPPSVEFGCSD